MKRCPFCKEKILDDAQFCPVCGREIPLKRAGLSIHLPIFFAEKQYKKRLYIAGIAVVGAALAVGTAAYMTANSTTVVPKMIGLKESDAEELLKEARES